MNAQFGVIVERDRDLRIVRPIGELDISTVGELATVVERECSSQADLVVDLRGLSFLDCAGLRILLYARAREQQRQLPTPHPRPGHGAARL